MLTTQSYKINAAAKQHERLASAVHLFDEAKGEIQAHEINPTWFMARVRDLAGFGETAEIAIAKCEAALRNQLLSGLRVVTS
jgi:hypothetical protein